MYTSSFEWAFTNLMHLEGGFSDHAADPGGPTKFGISLRYLRKVGKLDLDKDGDVDIDDIRLLTIEDAERLYYRDFWLPARCGEITSDLLSCKIFDMVVNMGQRQAYRVVQAAVKELSVGVTIDGIVGPHTLRALNENVLVDYHILQAIRARQSDFYSRLVANKPELRHFLLGWQRRAVH